LDFSSQILNLGSTVVTLSELENICNISDYSVFAAAIADLAEKGVIKPMGSHKDTNGMIPPLRRRYRICRPKADYSDIQNEILRLGTEFNPSGYLAHIPLYIKHRELLLALRDYVQKHSIELGETMSKNERAYAIWGNEKQLDDPLCKGMLGFIHWENRLNYYYTPEPFFDCLCGSADTESILIMENKDIWFTLRKLFMERPPAKGYNLYGRFFDGLVYGEGKKITRPGALEGYAEGFRAPPRFCYWGDLDYEGIGIYQKISHPSVTLFVQGYLAMLNYSSGRHPSKCRTGQTPPEGLEAFLRCFDSAPAEKIQSLLATSAYIPQEICSYPLLKQALENRHD